jgi:hypothetical protein
MGRGDFSGSFANTVIRPWALNSGVIIIVLLPIGQADIASSPKTGLAGVSGNFVTNLPISRAVSTGRLCGNYTLPDDEDAATHYTRHHRWAFNADSRCAFTTSLQGFSLNPFERCRYCDEARARMAVSRASCLG